MSGSTTDGPGGAADQMIEELKELRKAPMHTFEDFNRAPTLLWHIGRGDVDTAVSFFARLEQIDDLHVRAAIASIQPRPEDNLEHRMNDFAETLRGQSTRTIRRWTDHGFEIIAQLVLEWSAEEGHDRPLLEVRLEPQGADAVLLQLTGIAPPGPAQILPPEVRSTGEPMTWLDDDELDPADHFKSRTIARFAPQDERDRSLFIRWLGNRDVYFQVEVLPGVMPKHSLTVAVMQHRCELRWEAHAPSIRRPTP